MDCQQGEMVMIQLTDIARSATSRGHDTRVFHFREAKVANHDFAIFIRTVIEQIFRL